VSEHFDLIVIGSGSAAREAAGKASREHGARVALVERERWGGSCPNVACRPTKAYLVAAEQVHDINAYAEERGILTGPASVDLARLRAWKESLHRDQASWIDVLSKAYTLVPGEATLVDAHTIRVGDRELTADRILIASGSRTAVPATPGIEDIDWLDHITALDLDVVPASLLVIGGGPVGLEFAQIFERFGSRVTIVHKGDQIAARSDAEAAQELRASLEEEGIEIIFGEVDRFARVRDDIEATIGDRTLTVSHVLIASGRVANTKALNLEHAGVETGNGFIVVDERQHTTAESIWAAGDVAIGPQLTPVAQYQARIAVHDMYGVEGSGADYSVLPTAVFTDPELASVGMTEHEARTSGHDIDVVKHPLSAVTRAQYLHAKHGLYKIIFDRETRKVLGVHVVSRGGSDIVGALAPALKLGVTVDDLAQMHHVYPSYSEGLKAAAEQALTP
jgi:mercuric reductase